MNWAALDAALGRLSDWLHHPAPAAQLGCFCSAYGLLLAAFAHSTLPSYLNLLELTSFAFPFPPFDQLPVLPVLPARVLAALRWALVGCGAGLAAGVAPRPSLLAAVPLLVYLVQLDRTLYNNHCAPFPSPTPRIHPTPPPPSAAALTCACGVADVLMVQLAVLLCCCDDAVLRWPRGTDAGGGRSGAPATVPRWQPLAAQLLILTPYFFGGVAKLNPDWLLLHEPVQTQLDTHGHGLCDTCSNLQPAWSQIRSWAPGMLERLDATLGGWLDRTLPAVDVVPPFATFICWSGLLFDLAIPFALLFGGPRLRWGVALPAATTFNALNKAWFHLGVFPYLMLASLVLFFPPFPPSPPPSTSAAVRHQLPAADAAAAAAATCKDKGGRSRSPARLRARHVATLSAEADSAASAAACTAATSAAATSAAATSAATAGGAAKPRLRRLRRRCFAGTPTKARARAPSCRSRRPSRGSAPPPPSRWRRSLPRTFLVEARRTFAELSRWWRCFRSCPRPSCSASRASPSPASAPSSPPPPPSPRRAARLTPPPRRPRRRRSQGRVLRRG